MDPIILFLRLLLPLTIFHAPLAGGLASLVLDGLDWHVNLLDLPNLHTHYAVLDKFLDLYYLTIEAYMVLRWKVVRDKAIALGLYGLRVVGMMLFFVLGNEVFLVLFPNIFEVFFLFYLAWSAFTRKKQMSSWLPWASVVVLGIPKVIQEYWMHVVSPMNWQQIPFIVGPWHGAYDNLYTQIGIGILWLIFVT
jgi:hypothetical protein